MRCFIYVLAYHILFLLHINGAPQRLPFPNLTDFKISDIGKPVHIFEGIDYDLMDEKFREEYSDCYGDFIRCVRFRTHFNPICGYDPAERKYSAYYSQCELDLQNCHKMVRGGLGKFGKKYTDRYIYFVGEGQWCEHYFRTGENIEGNGLYNTTILTKTLRKT